MIQMHRMNSYKLVVFALALLLVSCGGDKEKINDAPDSGNNSLENFGNQYQIGSQWSRNPVTSQTLIFTNDLHLEDAAYATGRISTLWQTGTAIYLGRFYGKHLVATNSHVLKNIPSCAIGYIAPAINFSLIGKSFRCNKLIGSWPEIDFALLELKVSQRESDFLELINPLRFDWKDPLEKGTPLLTLGHGKYKNSKAHLTENSDPFCKVFSSTGKVKKISNKNENPKEVYSFATGCDISNGDSGSALINRRNGKVIGMVWSTYSPKPMVYRSDSHLNNLFDNPNKDIWKYLSYGVPAKSIRGYLRNWVNNTRISSSRKRIIRLFLSDY